MSCVAMSFLASKIVAGGWQFDWTILGTAAAFPHPEMFRSSMAGRQDLNHQAALRLTLLLPAGMIGTSATPPASRSADRLCGNDEHDSKSHRVKHNRPTSFRAKRCFAPLRR